jgi:hypothetical protein
MFVKPAAPARGRASDRGAGGAEAGGLAQLLGLVGALPREVVVLAAEVPVGGGLLVDRAVQVQALAEGARAQVEVLVDELLDLAAPIFSVPNVSTMTETGWRDADGVGDLDLGALGQAARRRRSWPRGAPRRRPSGRPWRGPCR